MRAWNAHDGLSVRATAGTHTVLLGLDLEDPAGCLGFGIHRTDHTEDEAYWLRGMKRFASVVPHAAPGMDFPTHRHPIQGFLWGDYSAKPDHDYTYRVVGIGGTPAQPRIVRGVSVRVRTEAEDDGRHGIWFNRGVAGSQAFVKRFGSYVPPVGAAEDHPAFAWLARGLDDAFLAFVARASGPRWGLRGAFYEFTWRRGLEALAAAAGTGADVRLVVHGRDRDPVGDEADHDRTASDSREAAAAAGIPDDVIVWRTARNKSALQHNKFLVLTHQGEPVAVWTGSTNLTQGAIFGHLNVGHLITDAAVASRFVAYWEQLADQGRATAQVREWTTATNPVDQAVPAADGLTGVFSPRETHSTLLEWYGDLFDSATSSAHITGAFGLHRAFRDRLADDRDVVRTVLLDQRPKRGQEISLVDPDVRLSWGNYLRRADLDQWAAERLTNFNVWVKFVHTKIILIDPMTLTPTVLTGSANYSDNSTTDNEENTVVIRGGTGEESAAARRVADIYLTEYQRLFMHFVFRDMAGSPDTGGPAGTLADPRRPDSLSLVEDDTWTTRHYVAGSWRARQRTTFAARDGVPQV